MTYDVILTCNYSPWSSYSGGAQKSVHMVAAELARQGLRVAVVYSKGPWERVRVPSGLPYDAHWATFLGLFPGISSPLRFLNGVTFLLKLRALSSGRTVVHGNGDEASLLWLLRRKRLFVHTNRYPQFPAFLRGADWKRPSTWLRVMLHDPRFVALALAIRKAGALTVTSASSRLQVAEAFGNNALRARVVYNGIDPVFLAGGTGLPSSGTGVLFYGRLTAAKGPDRVLEGYARLPEGLRALHPLRILGHGPLRADLERRAAELGVAVEFRPWLGGAALAGEIAKAKVVCLPSREESFGNTVAEALALGQTVVTSDAGSIPEVAGPWGLQVKGDAPSDWARALETALRGERPEEERRAQIAFVRERYSWEATAGKFREIYGIPGART